MLFSLFSTFSRSDHLFFVKLGTVRVIDCFSLVVRVSGALGHAKIQVQIHVYVDREEVISVSIRSLRMALCLEW